MFPLPKQWEVPVLAAACPVPLVAWSSGIAAPCTFGVCPPRHHAQPRELSLARVWDTAAGEGASFSLRECRAPVPKVGLLGTKNISCSWICPWRTATRQAKSFWGLEVLHFGAGANSNAFGPPCLSTAHRTSTNLHSGV